MVESSFVNTLSGDERGYRHLQRVHFVQPKWWPGTNFI